MSAPNLYHTLLRPPVIQILRAAGFHSASPAVIDTVTDLAARYLILLVSLTSDHANNSHDETSIPNLHDVIMALQDVGALRPQMSFSEETLRGEEDMPDSSPAKGCVDEDSLEKEDYLTALKKKHSKTGEESRYQGTVLGKSGEVHPIVIEGGAQSIKAWGMQVRSGEASTEAASSVMSSVPSSLSDVAAMEI
ncbi:bromodomain-containing protein [Histoplasma capsulatum H143]|uniref:Bromodomain-containing protein n=1 Tax=Ajellomyces capsulatus (strain H143) TaxID=544712 RepID=C6HR62_AJECH|nr:bromodomain-containing protein [Histoplasma capsulatum H143]